MKRRRDVAGTLRQNAPCARSLSKFCTATIFGPEIAANYSDTDSRLGFRLFVLSIAGLASHGNDATSGRLQVDNVSSWSRIAASD